MTLSTLDETVSNYRIIRSARRTLSLEVSADLEVLVRSPRWIAEREIRAFVEDKAGWIEKTRSRILKRQERPLELTQTQAGGLFFQGQLYPFWIDPSLTERFSFQEGFRIHPFWAGEPEKPVESWFRREAARILADRMNFFVSGGVSACKKIRIGRAQTRWGSCSPRGGIIFNWRLLMCPPAVIDYGVIHELCHLQEMNHSRNFWKNVKVLCPNYKSACKWLREHGDLLLRPIPKPILISGNHGLNALPLSVNPVP